MERGKKKEDDVWREITQERMKMIEGRRVGRDDEDSEEERIRNMIEAQKENNKGMM